LTTAKPCSLSFLFSLTLPPQSVWSDTAEPVQSTQLLGGDSRRPRLEPTKSAPSSALEGRLSSGLARSASLRGVDLRRP